MDFFIPQEMRIINKVLVKVRMSGFRAYSKSTSTRESQVISSTTTDTVSYTSTSGGGSSTTSSGGGGIVTDTGPGGINVTYENASTTVVDGHAHNIYLVDSHQHRITLPEHTHSVNIPSHSHSVNIPGHSHSVTVPAHAHDITPGIYEFGNPQRFSVYVNGTKKADFEGRTAELDVTTLLVGADNKIPRGSWLSLEVRPDDLAYVSMDLIVQGFVQSRGDNTV